MLQAPQLQLGFVVAALFVDETTDLGGGLGASSQRVESRVVRRAASPRPLPLGVDSARKLNDRQAGEQIVSTDADDVRGEVTALRQVKVVAGHHGS